MSIKSLFGSVKESVVRAIFPIPKESSPFPDEIVFSIFSRLSPQTLASNVSLVSTNWRRIALDPSLWRRFITIFDRAEWEKFADVAGLGLEFEPIPLLDMEKAVRKALPYFFKLDQEKIVAEDDEGVTFLTMPKNLNADKLISFIKKPKTGNRLENAELSEANRMPGRLGGYFFSIILDRPVPKTYRVMLSRGILTRTEFIFSRSEDFYENFVKKLGGRLPRPIEIVALSFTSFVNSEPSSPVRLFSSIKRETASVHYTYAFCCDSLVVGNFLHSRIVFGVFVSNYFKDRELGAVFASLEENR